MVSAFSRRRLLALLGGAAFATSGVTSGSKRSQAQDTTHPATGADHQMFGVTPGRTGHNIEATGPTEGVNIAWSRGGSGSGPSFDPELTLVDGRLYATDRDPVEIAPHTGTQTWSLLDDYDYANRFDSFVLVEDGRIYFPIDTSDYNEFIAIVAVNLETNEEEWRSDEFLVDDPTVWSVRFNLYNGSLFFNSDGIIISLDLATGNTNWRLESGNDVRGDWDYPLAIANETLYIAHSADNDNERLYAIGTDRGLEQWQVELADREYFDGNPVVADGICCIPTGDNLIGFDASNGNRLWTTDLGDRNNQTPLAAADGYLLAGMSIGDRGDGIFAYDLYSGQEEWGFNTGDFVNGRPTVVDGYVYVGAQDNTLYCLNLDTGEEVWSIQFRNPILGEAIVSDGWVYVVTEGGALFGLRGEEAGPPPVGDRVRDPTDPDHDGTYEDVNGDGEFDLGDVQGFYSSQESSAVQNNPSAFDFNGDGGIDIGDVQALFEEYLGKR